MRAAFIEKQSKRWDVANTERCVFGQVPDYMVYVASMCTTDQGLKLYQKVMRAFPSIPPTWKPSTHSAPWWRE